MEARRTSTHTKLSRLRPFLRWFALPYIFCILVLAAACSSSTAPRTPTITINPPPVLSATHTTEPSPISATPTDTLPPTLEPPDWLIEENSFSINIDWTEDEIPSEQVTLVVPGGDLGYSKSDYPPIFDYLTWSGTRGRLFEIEYNGNFNLESPAIFYLSPTTDRFIAFTLSDALDLREIYWIDVQTRQVFGYDPPCKSITTIGEDALAIGPEWFAYVCDEDQTTWHLFSLEDPSVTTSLQLPFNNELSKGFRPSWLGADTLILNHRARPINRCVVDLNDPSEPVVSCQEFDPDLTLGRFSSDGTLMELRASYNTTNSHPQEIGVINTDCFASSIGCFPHLYPSPFGPDAGPRGVFLEDGAWLPDSNGILYVQLQSINSAWADKTYLWTFDLHQEKFAQIAYLDDPLVFYQDYNQSAPIWSPDETRVLLQNFSKIYAFDLTDNTLQLLNDDGGIAIGTVVLP